MTEQEALDTIGVVPPIREAQLRRAYRQALVRSHPDRFTNPSEKARAEERCKRLAVALDTLLRSHGYARPVQSAPYGRPGATPKPHRPAPAGWARAWRYAKRLLNYPLLVVTLVCFILSVGANLGSVLSPPSPAARLLAGPWRQMRGPLSGYSFALPANYRPDPRHGFGHHFRSLAVTMSNEVYTPNGESATAATGSSQSAYFVPIVGHGGIAFWVCEMSTTKGNTFFNVNGAQNMGNLWAPGTWNRDVKDWVPSPYREAVYRLGSRSGRHADLMVLLGHGTHALALVTTTVGSPGSFRQLVAKLIGSVRM